MFAAITCNENYKNAVVKPQQDPVNKVKSHRSDIPFVYFVLNTSMT
jgi:hypothetical protein